MQGSRDILFYAHVLCPAWKSAEETHCKNMYPTRSCSSARMKLYQAPNDLSNMKIANGLRRVSGTRKKRSLKFRNKNRWLRVQVLFTYVLFIYCIFQWWFVQSILWLSSAPCSAVSRHRFSASGVQWSTRVRADRTSPWHWYCDCSYQHISHLSIKLITIMLNSRT